ncbi:MAG: TolC family protein [Crocinitomicaceae bacterium]|nr:TolC family protein [Crocinitomicaceae bacterium]
MTFKNYFCVAGYFYRRCVAFTLLFFFAAVNPLSAQTENLKQLLERGQKNYSLLKAKRAEVSSSTERIEAAQTEYLPDLIIGHQYTYATGNNVEGAFLPNGGSALSPSGGIRPDNIYVGAFGSLTSSLFNWEIVNFGRVSANINSASAENKKNEADYENELFQYKVRLADNYLLLLASQYLTKVQQQNLKRAEVLVNTIRAQVNAGLRPGVDSSLANAEYVKAKLLLLESEKNEKIYEYRLCELLEDKQDSLTIDTMNFFSDLPKPAALESSNFSSSPLLKLYESSIELSKARGIVIRRSFYPSLSLTGAIWARGAGISNQDQTYRTDFLSGTNYQVYNYLAGITFRWNLTSYLRIRNDFKSEQFQTERYQYLYQYQLNLQNREMAEAEIQLSVSLQQAELAPVQLKAAQQAYEQAKARYESGLIDLPTYQLSLNLLSRADADCYIAYASAWRALLMKAAAAGDLSLF